MADSNKLLVSFKKGLKANLPATKTPGTFMIVTDERAAYFDVDASTRIRLGDFQVVASVSALEAIANPNDTALYYVEEGNILARYDSASSKWVQINKVTDTGATSVETVGEGNAVTTASYDATTRKLTLTKGEKFATEAVVKAILNGENIDSFADVESALAGKQDTIAENTYDAYGAAATAKSEILGNASTDTKDSATIAGVKKYADDKASTLLGTTDDESTAETVRGARKLAAEKVASVTAGDDSVNVVGTATAPTVAAKLDPTTGNALKLVEGKGLRVDIPSADTYEITKDADSGDYAAVYRLKKNGTTDCGLAINIPKDKLIKSGRVETKTEAGAWGEAGTYIVIELQNTDDILYVDVSTLIEYVSSGSQAGDMVVVSVDETTHKVTATITDGTITAAKLTSEVQGKINQAHTHDNKTVLDGITAAKVSAWDGEVGSAAAINAIKDGESIDSFGDVETALSGKQDTIPANTYDAYGAAATAQTNAVNSVTGQSTDDEDDLTLYGLRAYADSVVESSALCWEEF